MPREGYQHSLDDLREAVLDMAALVGDRYRDALRAAETGDVDLARRVIEGDGEVNDRYLALERECVDLIALQQPVAGDLRLVVASFKIITDLERVADLATNLAGYARPHEGGIHPAVDLPDLGGTAGGMVEDAVAAYGAADADACREVAARDDDLDRACRAASDRVVRDLLAAAGDGDGSRPIDRAGRSGADPAAGLESALDDASRALLTVRDVERVGDHAVNIAARTLYMVENDEELIY